MRRLKKCNKHEIRTIPNGLRFLRLLLIPLIVWLYCGRKEYGATITAIAVSALTDIMDGETENSDGVPLCF